MKYKKEIMLICIFLCILFTISSVSAGDVEINETVSDEIQDIVQDNYNESQMSAQDSDDELAASTVYFDASASSDGVGTKSSPYKYFKPNRISDGTTAHFASGVYTMDSTLTLYSYYSNKVSLIGEGSGNTILKTTYYSSVTLKEDSSLLIQGITFQGVYFQNEGNLEAKNVVFKNSQRTYIGGSIYTPSYTSANPTLKLSNCEFRDNPKTSKGGFISVYKSDVIIENCIFYNSNATAEGGAINAVNSKVTIRGSKFYYNYAKYGGVMFLKNDTLTIEDSEFKYSSAYSFGGVISSELSNLTVNRCNFTDYESLTDAGGAIYSVSSDLNIQSSLFENGKSVFGGAICNLKSDLDVQGSTFINNYAQYLGGSIYNVYGDINIKGNEFRNSRAGKNGGVVFSRLSDSFKLVNNLFINASAEEGYVLAIDKDSTDIVESGNVFRSTYTLVARYEATLNGESYHIMSNEIHFSVSSDGTFLPIASSTTSNSDGYTRFSIAVSGKTGTKINSKVNDINSIVFSLDKYCDGFEDKYINLYFIADSGQINFDGYLYLGGDEEYTNEKITDYVFQSDIMKYDFVSNQITFTQDSVPVIDYDPDSQILPSSYDSRDYGYITPVKYQADGGNCWAFSAVATLEACLKKATGYTFDFSEENVKNLMAEYSAFGRKYYSNEGGNKNMVMGYFAGWLGPIYDETDVYDPHSDLSMIYSPIFHVQNIYNIPDRISNDDNELIKRAIMEYGAVSISLPWDDGYHAISLVGWDDNYNSYDYEGKYATGAWIFKNSYDVTWKEKGFSYVSYEHYIYNAYTFIFDDEEGYTDIYQYDFSGLSDYWYKSTSNLYFKNKFTSKGKDILAAASTYFKNPTKYVLSVYLNGQKVSTQEGVASSGYYTIPLINEVQLKKGDIFEVEFKIYGSSSNYLPYSQVSTFTGSSYASTLTFGAGMSFYSTDGSKWYDLYGSDSSSSHNVACIKAFTRPATLQNLTITMKEFSKVQINEMVSICVDIPKEYFNIVTYNVGGFITYTINNKDYLVKIEDGRACLNMTFNKLGLNTFKAQYKSSREISNIISFTFNVVDSINSKVSISASDVIKYYGGSQKYVAKVLNNGAALNGVNVDIYVGNEKHTVKTDSNGQATLDLTLAPGSYYITACYDDKECTSKFVVKSTNGVGDAVGQYLNAKVNATFINSYGNPLNGGKATFKINGRTFLADIVNGVATADLVNQLDLVVGNYTGTAINPSTGEESQFNLEIVRAKQNISATYIQRGNNLEITVTVYSGLQDNGYVCYLTGDAFLYDKFENGRAVIRYDNVSYGTHTFIISIYGDENFESELILDTIPVVDENLNLTAEDLTVYYGCNTNYEVKLAFNNEALTDKMIFFKLDGIEYFRHTDQNGVASLRINKAPGTYEMRVSYEDLTIIRHVTVKSTIFLSSADFNASSSRIKVKFLDSNGNPLKKTSVKFKVNDNTLTATTDDSGIANPFLSLNTGVNTLTATNPETNEMKSVNITLNKPTPNVSYTKEVSGNNFKLTVNFSPSTATGLVLFSFSGTLYISTIENGKASVTFENLTLGTYSVSVQYQGDSNYNRFTKSYSFTMSKTTPTLTLQLVERNGKDAIMAKLSASDATGTITFTCSGTDYPTGIIDGISYLTLSGTGKYTVSAKYSGNDYYYSVSKSATFDVPDKTPQIKVKDFTKTYLDTKKLSIRLLDYTGKAMSSKTINIEIDDDDMFVVSQVNKKTDSSGYVKLPFNRKPGTYYVYVSYGDAYGFSEVVVKKAKSIIKASKKTFKAKTKTKKFKVGLEIKGYYLTYAKMTLKVGGKTYKATTNSKGKATFKIKKLKKKGTYTATIKYKGTSYFKKVTKKVKIKVK